MRTWIVLSFIIVAACSSGGSSTVGAPCSSNGQCSSLSSGYCANAGVCTRPCVIHSDCGCPTNTTNDDIAQGGCGAACIDFGGSVGAVCTHVCGNNGDCEGATTCDPAAINGFNLGYSGVRLAKNLAQGSESADLGSHHERDPVPSERSRSS